MRQCARQTHCQFGNNSRAKWDPSQSSEGSGKKINNIKIKLNTPITSKFFTGFWFNVNPKKALSIQCYNKTFFKKMLRSFTSTATITIISIYEVIWSRMRLILFHCLLSLSLRIRFLLHMSYFLNGKKYLIVGMPFNVK